MVEQIGDGEVASAPPVSFGMIPATGRTSRMRRRKVRRWGERLCAALLLLAFLLPGVVQMVSPSFVATGENRRLAPLPKEPVRRQDWLELPAAISAYLGDHFGWRTALLKANNRLRFALFHETATRQLVLGPTGRLFLSSHVADQPYSLIHAVCGVGIPQKAVDDSAAAIRRLLDLARQDNANNLFVLVPTAPALYPDELPGWLKAQCAGHARPADQLAERMKTDPDHAGAFVYPLGPMLNQAEPAIPRSFFHWSGMGPQPVAAAIAETKLGMARAAVLTGRRQTVRSDLSGFNIGVRFADSVMMPDFQKSGVHICAGPSCFPELGADAGIADGVLERHDRPGGGKRLLLVGDSYGGAIAGFFTEYFGHVLRIDTNQAVAMSRERADRLHRFAWQEFAPDAVVFLFHDYAMFSRPAQLIKLLWPDATAPGEVPLGSR